MAELALGISEQVRQKLLHALHGVKQLIHAGSFPSDLVVGEIRDDGIAQLCGAPDALADEERKQRLRIVARDLTLLPLLPGPGGLADVIHGVAEIRQDALIDATGANGMLELQQLRTGFLQLKVYAPERFAGNQEFDGHSDHASVFAANSDHADPIGFPGKQIGQLHLASDTREDLHVQQAALFVYFAGLRVFDDDAPAGLLPFGLHWDNDGKTAATALVRFCGRRRRDKFFQAGSSSAEEA
jgi:hypothetical protein